MLKLMSIEMKKVNFKKMMVTDLIVLVLICLGIVALITNMERLMTVLPSPELTADMLDDMNALSGFQSMKEITDAMIAVAFLIYASVNYGRFIVKDFTNNMLQELYSYPVSRTKLLYAKITLSSLMTVFAMVVVKSLVYGYLGLTMSDASFTMVQLAEILTSSIAITCVAQIAMAVGVWKKSIIATIVTSAFVATFTQGNLGTITMYNFPAVTYAIAVVGIVSTYVLVLKQKKYEFFN